jgi:hypothetical protein
LANNLVQQFIVTIAHLMYLAFFLDREPNLGPPEQMNKLKGSDHFSGIHLTLVF